MAKLGKMPSKEIIDGFKGLIDFYYWKGIPVARKWPVYQPRQASIAELQTRAIFKFLNQIYSTLPIAQIVALTELATGTTLTPKDMLIRLYWKGLWDIMDPPQIATEPTQLLNLAELEDALKTGDLSIQAITKYLEISVKESILPTDAATEAQLVAIDTRLDAIQLTRSSLVLFSRSGALASDPGYQQMLSVSAKGILVGVALATNSSAVYMAISLDGQSLLTVARDGGSTGNVNPVTLNQLGGESRWWKELLYDAGNNYYAVALKQEVEYNAALVVSIYQAAGVEKNVALLVWYRPIT